MNKSEMFKVYLFLVCSVFALPANAKTVASFDTENANASILVDNEKTADADFLWNLMSTEVKEKGDKLIRSVHSQNREVTISCQRSTQRDRETTCVMAFLAVNEFVVIGKDEKYAGAQLSGSVGRAFLKLLVAEPETPFLFSPDETIIQCWGCGGAVVEIAWSGK